MCRIQSRFGAFIEVRLQQSRQAEPEDQMADAYQRLTPLRGPLRLARETSEKYTANGSGRRQPSRGQRQQIVANDQPSL